MRRFARLAVFFLLAAVCRPALGQTVFAIDTTQSSLNVAATLEVGGLSDDAAVEVGVQGTVTAALSVDAAGDGQVHVTGLELTTLEALHLEFQYGCFPVLGCTAEVIVDADSAAVSLSLLEAGAAVGVRQGTFVQAGNRVRFAATLEAEGRGAAAGEVPSGEQSAAFDTVLVFPGTVTAAGDLAVPIVLTGTADLGGRVLSVAVTGLIVAEAVGKVATEPETPAHLAPSLDVFPNPSAGPATLTYTLPAPVPVALTVTDLLGREVAAFTRAPGTPGRHTIHLDAAAWPSGVYLARLVTGGRTTTRTLVVAR